MCIYIYIKLPLSVLVTLTVFQIDIPMLVLNAEDDPLVPLPLQQIAKRYAGRKHAHTQRQTLDHYTVYVD